MTPMHVGAAARRHGLQAAPSAHGRWPRAGAVLALAITAWVPAAQAQMALSAAEKAFVGRWDIAHADDTPDHCGITLLKDETIGGRQVRLNKACAKALAWTADVTAWRALPDGGVALADALRHTVIGFKPDEAGDLQGPGPDRAIYVLYPAKAKRAAR